MLNADIDSLLNLCTINKQYNKLCTNSFWIQKFNHDNLPLHDETNKTTNKWVKLYKKTKKIHDKTEEIINSLKINDKILILVDEVNKNMYLDMSSMYFLPVEVLTDIPITTRPNFINITMNDDNIYLLKFFALSDRIYEKNTLINKKTLYDILFIFLFDEKTTIK